MILFDCLNFILCFHCLFFFFFYIPPHELTQQCWNILHYCIFILHGLWYILMSIHFFISQSPVYRISGLIYRNYIWVFCLLLVFHIYQQAFYASSLWILTNYLPTLMATMLSDRDQLVLCLQRNIVSYFRIL